MESARWISENWAPCDTVFDSPLLGEPAGRWASARAASGQQLTLTRVDLA
jgi:hypothetical protein